MQQIRAEKFKTRHDWVGELIIWELRNKFDHTNKWYMHNPESIMENETRKFLLDFETQTEEKIYRHKNPMATLKSTQPITALAIKVQIEKTTKRRKQIWKKKPLYGYFKR